MCNVGIVTHITHTACTLFVVFATYFILLFFFSYFFYWAFLFSTAINSPHSHKDILISQLLNVSTNEYFACYMPFAGSFFLLQFFLSSTESSRFDTWFLWAYMPIGCIWIHVNLLHLARINAFLCYCCCCYYYHYYYYYCCCCYYHLHSSYRCCFLSLSLSFDWKCWSTGTHFLGILWFYSQCFSLPSTLLLLMLLLLFLSICSQLSCELWE